MLSYLLIFKYTHSHKEGFIRFSHDDFTSLRHVELEDVLNNNSLKKKVSFPYTHSSQIEFSVF